MEGVGSFGVVAYFEDRGFENVDHGKSFEKRTYRPDVGGGARTKECWIVSSQGCTWRATYWRPNGDRYGAKPSGRTIWHGPEFPDPITAYVHAEVESWGEE